MESRPRLSLLAISPYATYPPVGGGKMRAYHLLQELMLLGHDATLSEIWPYAIRRAGMSEERFCGIVEGIWTVFLVQRGRTFTKHPIDKFRSYMDELDRARDYANVIFAK